MWVHVECNEVKLQDPLNEQILGEKLLELGSIPGGKKPGYNVNCFVVAVF